MNNYFRPKGNLDFHKDKETRTWSMVTNNAYSLKMKKKQACTFHSHSCSALLAIKNCFYVLFKKKYGTKGNADILWCHNCHSYRCVVTILWLRIPSELTTNLLYYKTLGILTSACVFSETVMRSHACCI